jgi:iron(III) transport system ATP-binding protein
MAISDRILLLNNGRIEQQGTPQEMYGTPATLFCAEFMGSNNRLAGQVTEIRDGSARVEGAGWSVWGKAGAGVAVGQPGVAMIRVERVRLEADASGNQIDLPLVTTMYLGDKWEYLFRLPNEDALTGLSLRAYGQENLAPGQHSLSLPARHVWVYPQPAK